MGGPGSGHWRRPLKRTVEECVFLDINEFVRNGLTTAGEAPVFIKSVSALRKKKVVSINYQLERGNEDNPVLNLMYGVDLEGRREEVEEPVPLQTTRPHFGGKRWWFTCPLEADGIPCLRRVGKLYLPPGGLYFGCRHCYDLTYRSSQENRSGEWFYRLISEKIPGATPEMMKRSLIRSWEKNTWGV